MRRRNAWFDKERENARLEYRRAIRHTQLTHLKRLALKQYKSVINKKRTEYHTQVNDELRSLCQSNTQAFWSKLKNMESVEETLSIDLETLTQHFISLNQAPDVNDCHNEHVVVNNVDQMLTDDYLCILNRPFDLKEVQCCVKKLKNGTSAGQDNLFPELFKYAPTDFYVILTNFFNDILEKGQIPDDWGLSIICPIYKKGQMSDPNNYRGISLIDCLAKIFTRIL